MRGKLASRSLVACGLVALLTAASAHAGGPEARLAGPAAGLDRDGALAPNASPSAWWAVLAPTFEAGLVAYREGRFEAAAERFSQTIPANPYASFHNRGLCRWQLGQTTAAKADFEAARRLARTRDDRAQALLAISACQLRDGDPRAALTTLKGAAGSGPQQRAMLYLNTALAHEAREQYGAAQAALARALKTAPTLREQLGPLPEIIEHLASGDQRPFRSIPPDPAAWPRTLAELTRALERRPGFEPARTALNRLALTAERAGERELAESARAALAARLDPPPEAFLTTGCLPGNPTPDAEPLSLLDRFAGRWEHLPLMLIVWTILLLYLRMTHRRRQARLGELSRQVRQRSRTRA